MTETPTSTNKPRIRHLAGARYVVESFTRPGIGHQVDVLHLRCGCEAGSYNRRCKHLVLALEYDAWRRKEQEKAREQMQAGSQWVAPQQASAAGRAASEAQSSSTAVPAPVAQQTGTGELAPLWLHFE